MRVEAIGDGPSFVDARRSTGVELRRSVCRRKLLAMQNSDTATATAASLVAELRSLGSEENRAGMARYGIAVDKAFGIPVQALREIAKRVGRDHDLALALWATGHHEARLLACFVDDPAAVTVSQMEAWAGDFDSWDLCDQATTSLFDRTPHAWAQAAAWAQRNEPWVKRGGFTLMAGLAIHDRAASEQAFVKLFPSIRRGAFDERNFVKKAVSWALRNIGKRNAALHAAAIECANSIRAAADESAGGARGGDARARSARWVAADVLRELESEKTRARVGARSGSGASPSRRR